MHNFLPCHMLPFLVSKQAKEETIINRNDGAHFLWQLTPVFPNFVYSFQRGFLVSNFVQFIKKTSLKGFSASKCDVGNWIFFRSSLKFLLKLIFLSRFCLNGGRNFNPQKCKRPAHCTKKLEIPIFSPFLNKVDWNIPQWITFLFNILRSLIGHKVSYLKMRRNLF